MRTEQSREEFSTDTLTQVDRQKLNELFAQVQRILWKQEKKRIWFNHFMMINFNRRKFMTMIQWILCKIVHVHVCYSFCWSPHHTLAVKSALYKILVKRNFESCLRDDDDKLMTVMTWEVCHWISTSSLRCGHCSFLPFRIVFKAQFMFCSSGKENEKKNQIYNMCVRVLIQAGTPTEQ